MKVVAKGGMHGRAIVLTIVGAMLGFLVLGAGECQAPCSCPPPTTSAAIELGCVPSEPPVVTTTGPCSVCPATLPNGMIPAGAGYTGHPMTWGAFLFRDLAPWEAKAREPIEVRRSTVAEL